MAETLYLLLNAALVACAVISLIFWVRVLPAIFRQGVRGFADECLPVSRRECPSWGVSEIFVMFGATIVSQQLLLLFSQQKGWYEFPEPGESLAGQTPEALFVVLVISALANCIAISLTLLWLWNIDRANLGKFGLSLNPSMIGLGVKAAVTLLPPVLAVAALVNLFLAKYEHDVLDVLQQLGTPRVFVVLFFGTAIVTPVAEEILFRGLIQGWFQRLADRVVGQVESTESNVADGQLSVDQEKDAFSDENVETCDLKADLTEAPGSWEPVSYWPIFASSILFASMHMGQGAAPIPLFLLSVGLGYLYRQTGSLIPCIVVHMMLNGMTLLAAMLR